MHTHTYTHTHTHTHIQTGRYTGRQAHTDKYTHRHIQRDAQTDRNTRMHTHTDTNKLRYMYVCLCNRCQFFYLTYETYIPACYSEQEQNKKQQRAWKQTECMRVGARGAYATKQDNCGISRNTSNSSQKEARAQGEHIAVIGSYRGG